MFEVEVQVCAPFCRCGESDLTFGVTLSGTTEEPLANHFVKCRRCGHKDSTPTGRIPVTITQVPGGTVPPKNFRE